MADAGENQNTPPISRFWEGRAFRYTLAGFLALILVAMGVFSFYYGRLARKMDAKLRAGPFSDSVNLYAAPERVEVGDRLTPQQLVSRLSQAGYSTSRSDPVGWYNQRPETVEIFPGSRSYAPAEPAVLSFHKGRLARIVALRDNTERNEYLLEPALVASISDKAREKRRLVSWPQIPPALVRAVISTEDKHFFDHSGVDMLRIVKAAYVDVKEGRKEQGASTLTMQLARGLWLTPNKSWKRKAAEFLMTMHLEERLSKEQIFEYYSNQVYLGRRGSFSINGFGEGARIYFGKDLGDLTLPEAATLAGMVQRPGYYNPIRHPDRTRERRNLVLALMRQNRYLSDAEYSAAVAAPVTVAPETGNTLDSDAAYFMDLVNRDLQERFADDPARTAYVYTTLDPDLQRAAVQAVESGMAAVDKALARGRKKVGPHVRPQVALVALDPRTGEVKALVGGRDYAVSQLNRALAQRQPGSVFKPFVYAAALNTAVEGGQKIFTAATTLSDEPTTFNNAGRIYDPGNFHDNFMGAVSVRAALAHSLNVATVKLAEEVGYAKVVDMARRCGLPDNLRPTPAVALGAYEASPLEIAGAYTAFANHGTVVEPALVSLVRSARGTELYRHTPQTRRALDPRVAYLVTNLMEGVLNNGTGAGVRARGFSLPAAGKTGTSHDGWFAGFTSELVAVVWVGFDDNRELNLEGARSALPVWTEFMKRAARLRNYRKATPFAAPPGVLSVEICEESGQLATALCPRAHPEEFIDGTQPVAACLLHSGGNYADRIDQSAIVPLPASSR